VLRRAHELKLKGYVKNQMDGTVLSVVEGEKSKIEALFNYLKVGPMHSDVRDIKIAWRSFVGEFSNFEVRRY
jgi:acylphosphatase